MNIQVVSDLHLDQLIKKKSIKEIKDLIIPTSEILILAGDICHIEDINCFNFFFEYLNSNFSYIIYIPGNHEFYNKKSLDIDFLNKSITNFLSNYNNFIYLYNKSVLIEDILFTGSCLWCNPSINPPSWFHINLKKEEISDMYKESIEYLNKVSDLKYDKHVIITHYPPLNLRDFNYSNYSNDSNDSNNIIDPKDFKKERNFKDEYYEYYNNKDIVLNYPPKYWIFGHTHKNFNKTINNITYISNQRKDKNYKNTFIISL
jgi:predicted phosphohydrolase